MILYCEHKGGGEELFGPIAEIDLRGIARDMERSSGTLSAVLDYLAPDATGRAAREGDGMDGARLTITCGCGLALAATWSTWLGFEGRQGMPDRLELATAKNMYQIVAKSLNLPPVVRPNR